MAFSPTVAKETLIRGTPPEMSLLVLPFSFGWCLSRTETPEPANAKLNFYCVLGAEVLFFWKRRCTMCSEKCPKIACCVRRVLKALRSNCTPLNTRGRMGPGLSYKRGRFGASDQRTGICVYICIYRQIFDYTYFLEGSQIQMNKMILTEVSSWQVFISECTFAL